MLIIWNLYDLFYDKKLILEKNKSPIGGILFIITVGYRVI
ncbi:hypothetical protein A1OE_1123 [Candidatus Endolissoclinum faulkneri L2]|uniref:Uncharacterized protein n=1 Tax=Candidatus Endolissoclinum faulkneri L2 TaxID=1193729 RepID=K7ZD88_9PROT|nr:hypothetical protein A1OE_1123 [Candidatus Endolissoclinum faulkneri L2]